jgi:integrase
MRAKDATTRLRLTKTTVEALSPSKNPYWDSDLTGFGILVSERGTRTYFVQKRSPHGRQCKVTIGRHGAWTAERVRARAKVLLGQIAAGIDPTAERRAARQAERKRLEAPTVEALLERYMVEHAQRKKRLTSIRTDRSLINKHFLPALGPKKVVDVTHADAQRLHDQISVTAVIAANRAASLGRKAFNLAIKWGWRTDNPFSKLERNPEEKRDRYLILAELARLFDALNRQYGDLAAAIIVFLLLTGARRNEVLSAYWRDFDPVAGIWTKPSAHTKQKKLHRVPLSAAARAVLVQLAQQYEPNEPPPDAYVFGGPQMIHRVRRTWEAVRDEAGLPGLRLHDLRHAYASVLASGGLSLPIIGALLGHTNPTTTARYAHLLDDPLRQATERVGGLWTALSNGADGELGPPAGGHN